MIDSFVSESVKAVSQAPVFLAVSPPFFAVDGLAVVAV